MCGTAGQATRKPVPFVEYSGGGSTRPTALQGDRTRRTRSAIQIGRHAWLRDRRVPSPSQSGIPTTPNGTHQSAAISRNIPTLASFHSKQDGDPQSDDAAPACARGLRDHHRSSLPHATSPSHREPGRSSAAGARSGDRRVCRYPAETSAARKPRRPGGASVVPAVECMRCVPPFRAGYAGCRAGSRRGRHNAPCSPSATNPHVARGRNGRRWCSDTCPGRLAVRTCARALVSNWRSFNSAARNPNCGSRGPHESSSDSPSTWLSLRGARFPHLTIARRKHATGSAEPCSSTGEGGHHAHRKITRATPSRPGPRCWRAPDATPTTSTPAGHRHQPRRFGYPLSSHGYAHADLDAQGQTLLSRTVNIPTGFKGTVCWSDEYGRQTGVSAFDGGISITPRPGRQNVIVYTVTLPFAGDQVVVIALASTDIAQCLTTGRRRIGGPATLTVLPA